MQHGWRLGWRVGGSGLAGRGLPSWASRLGAALAARLLAERDRWLLWLPVCLSLGIASFFALPGEPPRVLGIVALALAAGAGYAAWRADRAGIALARAFGIALALVAAGFALADARLAVVRAPILPREASYDVTGRIVGLEPRGRGVRLLLDNLTLSRLEPAATPRRVRVTLAGGGSELAPGQIIRLRARLQPPAGPALPGGFDYARQAYFERLGGLGYGIGKPELLSAPDSSRDRVAELRARVARRITAILPGQTGAFAAALIAGVDAGIDARTWRAFQISGLAHLISISGLHMTLVAGTVFALARYALALLPWLALRVRVHKPAAILAFAAAGFYATLAGNSVPTQRSFLMLGVGLAAILADRNPFSLRVLAWAALAVLALRPEALLGASFQLSFAAVLALMATYEVFRLHETGSALGTGVLGHGLRYVIGVAATTVIASAATAPFAAYHFQNIATYGVVANLVAVPLTSFIVMPAGLLGLALMPFGLDELAIRIMGLGADAVLATARLVTALPGASVAVTQWPGSVLTLLSLGGLWLALWRRRWRLLGLIPCAVALLVVLLRPVPDLVIDPGFGAAARRLPDGRLVLLEWERDARRRQNWARANGVREPERHPLVGGERDGIACDPQACLVRLDRWTVSLSRTPAAAIEDCALADLVVSRTGPERCEDGGRLIGPRALKGSGGLAIRATADGLAIATVAASRGDWPWSPPFHSPLGNFIN